MCFLWQPGIAWAITTVVQAHMEQLACCIPLPLAEVCCGDVTHDTGEAGRQLLRLSPSRDERDRILGHGVVRQVRIPVSKEPRYRSLSLSPAVQRRSEYVRVAILLRTRAP